MDERTRLGRKAEALVARYYENQGYIVEAQNWLCRTGELDLVVCRDSLLVVVEVRSVSTEWLGNPSQTVTEAKQRRIAHAADAYLRQRTGDQPDAVRFDVVGVVFRPLRSPSILPIENAFVPPWAF